MKPRAGGGGSGRRKEAPLSIGAYLHINLRAHAKIYTRVRYLTQSEAEAWESANHHVPKRRFSKRHEHRARRRLHGTFKLLRLRARSPCRDHNQGLTAIAGIQQLREPRDRIRNRAKEVSRSINHQRLAVRLEHLLLQNGESSGVATQAGTGWGIARENSNLCACGQLFVYFPDGCLEIRIDR